MPEPVTSDNKNSDNKNIVTMSEGQEKVAKKSALDGLRASVKRKLSLARINMLDGSILDVNIEVAQCKSF